MPTPELVEMARLAARLPTNTALHDRLARLWQKLEDEGRYTDANTVSLAMDYVAGKAEGSAP